MKRVLRWATGILFGVAIVAVQDEYKTRLSGYRYSKEIRADLDNVYRGAVDWYYTD